MPSENVTAAIDYLSDTIDAASTSWILMFLWVGLLVIFTLIAVYLTVAMFRSKDAMLGFPCGMFWAIEGAYFYSLTFIDVFEPINIFLRLVGFACAFGMTIFTIIAAFGLRERRDSLLDVEMQKGEGNYIDEKGKDRIHTFGEEEFKVDDGFDGEKGDGDRMRERRARRNRIRKKKEDRELRRAMR